MCQKLAAMLSYINNNMKSLVTFLAGEDLQFVQGQSLLRVAGALLAPHAQGQRAALTVGACPGLLCSWGLQAGAALAGCTHRGCGAPQERARRVLRWGSASKQASLVFLRFFFFLVNLPYLTLTEKPLLFLTAFICNNCS